MLRSWPDPSSRIIQVRVAFVAGIFAVAPFWAKGGLGICLFHRLTGLECPLCGMTRAFYAISHGHFVQALHFNILSLAVYFFLAGMLIHDILHVAVGIRIPTRALVRVEPIFAYLILLFLLIAYGILRNTTDLP